MKIVVLCGGLSNERDVSISSGTCVANALRQRGHKVLLLDSYLGYEAEYNDPEELFYREQGDEVYRVKEREPDLEAVKKSRKQDNDAMLGDNVIEICRSADITFMALHGDDGENGKIQAAFDVAGLKYTGCGYLGSAIAMNKELSKALFRQNGIPTPPAVIIEKRAESYPDIGFPCVVKPCSGGSSVGTSVVYDEKDYKAAVDLAFGYEERVLAEKYIKGRELQVGVMDGKAMPVIEIVPKNGFYDYKNKYQAGLAEEICPANISASDADRISRLAEKVTSVLMIEVYCRNDFIMSDEDGTIYCLEANTLPGMTPTSLVPQMGAAMGLDYADVCEKIIEISLRKYEK